MLHRQIGALWAGLREHFEMKRYLMSLDLLEDENIPKTKDQTEIVQVLEEIIELQ
jgi:hypothetical protein